MTAILTSPPPAALPFDQDAEGLLTLQEASRLVPARFTGRGANNTTLWRWITKGIHLPGGARLRLEAVRVGGRWRTSHAAIRKFVAGLTQSFSGYYQGGKPAGCDGADAAGVADAATPAA